VVGSALTLTGVLVAVLFEDWRLGLGLLAFVAVAAVTIARLRNSAVPQATERQQALADLFGEVEQRLTGAEDLRANGGGGHAVRRTLEATSVLYRAAMRSGRATMRIHSITMAVFLAGSTMSLVVGTMLFSSGAISLGTVYLLFSYTALIRQPLEQISDELRHVQGAVAGLARINELLAIRASVRDEGTRTLPPGPLPLALDRVDFAYDKGKTVLTGLSIQVRPGSVLGVVGRTGSGKSTLARLLLRLADPTEGVVRIGGVDAREVQLDELRARVGLVTQEVQLMAASVRDNLTVFGAHPADDDRLVAVLDSLGLGEWYRALPDGLDTVLGPGGEGASAGEAQLLAFARVFVRDPGVVILDEAASRVDPASEARIERALDRLLAGRTTIVIAHRLGTVARADDILVLDGGRIAEHGPRQALADDPGSRFARLLATGLSGVAGTRR
jgi:ATP-binding cassette subfamily B protein